MLTWPFSATLGFITTTDSGSLLNRFVCFSLKFGIDIIIFNSFYRFSQDISQISQQMPMHFMESSYRECQSPFASGLSLTQPSYYGCID